MGVVTTKSAKTCGGNYDGGGNVASRRWGNRDDNDGEDVDDDVPVASVLSNEGDTDVLLDDTYNNDDDKIRFLFFFNDLVFCSHLFFLVFNKVI